MGKSSASSGKRKGSKRKNDGESGDGGMGSAPSSKWADMSWENVDMTGEEMNDFEGESMFMSLEVLDGNAFKLSKNSQGAAVEVQVVGAKKGKKGQKDEQAEGAQLVGKKSKKVAAEDKDESKADKKYNKKARTIELKGLYRISQSLVNSHLSIKQL